MMVLLKKHFPFFMLLLVSPAFPATKNVYGLHEKVNLPEMNNVVVKAKLDTGALTTSLGATNIQLFDKDGEKWVRFKPQIKGKDLPEMEKPLERKSKIKRRLADILSESKRLTSRPVVVMDMCFDGKIYAIEVNLTDRSHFNYPLLIGSTALVEFNAVVDPSLRYQSSSDCK